MIILPRESVTPQAATRWWPPAAPKYLRMEAFYQVLGTIEVSAAYSSRSLYFSTRCVGVLGSASRKRTLCGILKRARRAAHHACNASAVVWAPGRRTI